MNVNKKNPYSREKLCPVIAFFIVDGWEAAHVSSASVILQNEGAGHTMTLHTKNKDVVREFASEKTAIPDPCQHHRALLAESEPALDLHSKH
ncbi:hypothetical protein [Hungatella sp.]|uniref:hypothetical protein n=1 Tax=Hungatella sp. TaxID=2613924 RepID=UPI003993C902